MATAIDENNLLATARFDGLREIRELARKSHEKIAVLISTLVSAEADPKEIQRMERNLFELRGRCIDAHNEVVHAAAELDSTANWEESWLADNVEQVAQNAQAVVDSYLQQHRSDAVTGFGIDPNVDLNDDAESSCIISPRDVRDIERERMIAQQRLKRAKRDAELTRLQSLRDAEAQQTLRDSELAALQEELELLQWEEERQRRKEGRFQFESVCSQPPVPPLATARQTCQKLQSNEGNTLPYGPAVAHTMTAALQHGPAAVTTSTSSRYGPASAGQCSSSVNADAWIGRELLITESASANRTVEQFRSWPSSLPKLEFKKFNGDPTKWLEFISKFKSMVHDVVNDNAQRLGYLTDLLEPDVKATLGGVHDPSQYLMILDRLRSRYGQPHKIARAHMRMLLEIQPCRSSDLSSVVAFWTAVQSTVQTFQVNGNEAELESGTNVELLTEKLDRYLQSKWGRHVQRLLPTRPTLRHLEAFLENYVEGEELGRPCFTSANRPLQQQPERKKRSKHPVGNREPTVLRTTSSAVNTGGKNTETPAGTRWCFVCQAGTHDTTGCTSFRALKPTERAEAALKANYCFRCLAGKHIGRECPKSVACGIDGCPHKHHRFLHGAKALFPKATNAVSSSEENAANIRATRVQRNNIVLVNVIPVRLRVGQAFVDTFALLDGAADATFIRQDVAERLGLRGKIRQMTFGTFQGKEKVDTAVVEFLICSKDDTVALAAEAYTAKKLNASSQPVDWATVRENYAYLADLHVPIVSEDQVTVLIGMDLPAAHVHLEERRPPVGTNGPYAARSPFGWSLFGLLPKPGRVPLRKITVRYTASPEDDDLHERVASFWQAESFGIRRLAEKLIPAADRKALQHMQSTIKKVNGHYQVGLPWKMANPGLPDNRNAALHRFFRLEARFRADPVFAERYRNIIEEHIRLGHARRITNEAEVCTGRSWFIPHHAVINPNKPGKVRVVFDAAARFHGVCLNDALLRGPASPTSLFGVLIRFRHHRYAVSGDIEKMFYQVAVPKEDCAALRFFWRKPGTCIPPAVYEMTVQVFGAVSSPAVCNFALKYTAAENRPEFKDVAHRVTDNFYVDNYLDSFQTEEEAVIACQRLIELLRRGGFRLNQWISSSRNVLGELPTEERADPHLNLDLDDLPIERTLGLSWDCERDRFLFKFKASPLAHTKRQILAAVMAIFDPLGFLSPVVLLPKILLQDVWRENLDWDDRLPSQLQQRWSDWAEDLKTLQGLSIPRCLWPERGGLSESADRELHVFCDASEVGYGAVVFLRYTLNGQPSVSFLAAKALVAPTKEVTIPKLELQAAMIGMRLAIQVASELRFDITQTVYWTDSRTVLLWLNSSTCRFHTFVANRVGEILEATKVKQWRHVPGILNPADDCSRGLLPSALHAQHRWFTGPRFLLEEEDHWPSPFLSAKDEEDDLPEVAVRFTQAAQPDSPLPDLMVRCSSLLRLKRIVAWLRRAVVSFKSKSSPKEDQNQLINRKTPRPYLLASELKAAMCICVRIAQRKAFPEVFAALRAGAALPSRSAILKLSPFLDECHLLRVGGRLEYSTLPYSSKHPVILPSDDPLTDLVIRDAHIAFGHSRTERLLSELRREFWVIRGRSSINRVINKCITCKRLCAHPQIPRMAPLPGARVKPFDRPFTHVGVDYFGPMTVTVHRRTEKRWGCLFVCLTTRAVHIELAHSLDMDSFLLAFRNFIARRGKPATICSDNGTNLVAGERELREGLQRLNQLQIGDFMSQRGIEWFFNPPAAPHFGGVWERLVRSCKVALRATLGASQVKDEVLRTVLTEVEALLNGRPLTHISVDPADPEPITPNHFLMGEASHSLAPDVFETREIAGRSRWRACQAMVNAVWKRWLREYVPALTERQKWTEERRNIRVDDVVLVVDANNPRGQWPLGRVVAITPSADGVVRKVMVKTRGTMLERPVSKLCLLLTSSEIKDDVSGITDAVNRAGDVANGMAICKAADLS